MILKTLDPNKGCGTTNCSLLLSLFVGLIFFFLFMVDSSEVGIFKKDRIIYHLPSDTTKKIILQYYETGIPSNERYRLIETNDINASLRPIKEIKTQNNVISLIKKGCLGYGCSQVDTTKVPKIIEYQNEDYRFERVYND